MVRTALTIEIEIEDARDAGVSSKRKESQSSSSLGNKQRASGSRGFQSRPSGPGTDQSCRSSWADGVLPLPATRTYQEGLPPETGIPGFWDSAVSVNSRT